MYIQLVFGCMHLVFRDMQVHIHLCEYVCEEQISALGIILQLSSIIMYVLFPLSCMSLGMYVLHMYV